MNKSPFGINAGFIWVFWNVALPKCEKDTLVCACEERQRMVINMVVRRKRIYNPILTSPPMPTLISIM